MSSDSHSQTNTSFSHHAKYKVTEPPNPNWKLGQSVDATLQGREWLEGVEGGWQTIETSSANPAQVYKLMVSGIVPRPVAFVSTVSEDGIGNLACMSCFNQVINDPPVISIACTYRDTRPNDTAQNILTTKGFTVNVISEPWVQNANVCSVDAPPEVDEWPLSGLTKEPSIYVKAPRVRESAFSMECELLQYSNIIHPNTTKPVSTLILGTVKYIHVRKDVLNERGAIDIAKLKPISRLGDISFGRVLEGFRIPVPRWSNIAEDVKKTFGDNVASERKDRRKDEQKGQLVRWSSVRPIRGLSLLYFHTLKRISKFWENIWF